MRWLHRIIDWMGMSLSKLRELVIEREAWHATVHEVTNSWTWLSDWTELNWTFDLCFGSRLSIFFFIFLLIFLTAVYFILHYISWIAFVCLLQIHLIYSTCSFWGLGSPASSWTWAFRVGALSPGQWTTNKFPVTGNINHQVLSLKSHIYSKIHTTKQPAGFSAGSFMANNKLEKNTNPLIDTQATQSSRKPTDNLKMQNLICLCP